MSNTPITAAQAKEFDIKKCLVYSNDEKTQADIGSLITDLYYFEDVLSPSIKVDIMFADTATVNKDNSLKTVMEALQLVGTEKVELKLSDPNEKEISVTVYSDFVSAPSKEPRKSLVTVNLVSKELIFNYKTSVNYRLDGKISDHVTKILKETFKTKKKLDIEETSGEYNYCGVNHHGFATILTLARKAVPNTKNAKGNTAGFFFFETSEGFKFKSVEGLLSENEPGGGKKKYKSLAYNETPDGRGTTVPPEYDGKILEYNLGSTAGSVQSKLQIGTYSTKTVLFDPFNCYYEVVTPNTQGEGGDLGSEKNLQTAGQNLPKYNKEFNVEGKNQDYTRTQYMIIDKGTLPTGDTKQQIEKSGKENFDPKNILSQSTMRYNQFFSAAVEITITGDFSLHAGDYIFIDAPQNNPEDRNSMDKQLGGYYVIAKLCHYISPRSGGYTKLTLSRDSIGRKGSPTNPI
jgi:hypothetical protein